MKKKEKKYFINIPVFTSKPITKEATLFGIDSYESMTQSIIDNIATYTKNENYASKGYRNNIQRKNIKGIEGIEQLLGEQKSILLRISAYKTNINDGYFGKNIVSENKPAEVEINKIEKEDRFGSNNYFALLVPSIIGTNRTKQYWTIFIYGDPNKDLQDIISTIKLALNKIFKIKAINIKREDVIKEIKQLTKISEITVNYSSLKHGKNDVDVKLINYQIDGKLKKTKTDCFKEIPTPLVEELINNTEFKKEYENRTIEIDTRKCKYKIISERDINEANQIFKETVEVSFNEKISINSDEINNKLYDIEFIMSKFKYVVNLFA